MMSDACKPRFTTWINQKCGGAMLGEVVVAEDYDAAIEALKSARALCGDYLPPGNSNAMKAMKLVDAAIAKALASNT